MNCLFDIRKPWRLAGALVFGIGISSVTLHPSGQVKSSDPASGQSAILATADVPPEVRSILERSCLNCHSQKTAWPWYSYAPPMSWLIEKDVHQARSRMNFSKWDQYSLDERQQLLAEIAAMVTSKKMPLPRYTMLHPEARLSPADVQALYQWARTERRRVKGALQAPAASQ